MDSQTETTNANPNADKAAAPKGVEILDFWAEWCGPCKLMAPILDEIKKEYAGKITIKEIDVDDPANSEIRDEYYVMSVPTYIFLNNGEVAKQIVGAQSKEVFSQHIDELLKEASQSKE